MAAINGDGRVRVKTACMCFETLHTWAFRRAIGREVNRSFDEWFPELIRIDYEMAWVTERYYYFDVTYRTATHQCETPWSHIIPVCKRTGRARRPRRRLNSLLKTKNAK